MPLKEPYIKWNLSCSDALSFETKMSASTHEKLGVQDAQNKAIPTEIYCLTSVVVEMT